MKKHIFFLTALSITITFITSSCSTYNPTKDSCGNDVTNKQSESITETEFNETNDIIDVTNSETAYILTISLEHNYIMIGKSLDTDYFQQTHVLLKDSTTILINGIPSQLEDLAIGNQILITYTGGIAESAPAQMHWPIQIEVIE